MKAVISIFVLALTSLSANAALAEEAQICGQTTYLSQSITVGKKTFDDDKFVNRMAQQFKVDERPSNTVICDDSPSFSPNSRKAIVFVFDEAPERNHAIILSSESK